MLCGWYSPWSSITFDNGIIALFRKQRTETIAHFCCASKVRCTVVLTDKLSRSLYVPQWLSPVLAYATSPPMRNRILDCNYLAKLLRKKILVLTAAKSNSCLNDVLRRS